jgi:hypothetical protein
VFLAPWLTMVCRSPIAGTVFTIAIPGVLMALGQLLGVMNYGRGHELNAFRLAFLWSGTLGLCAIGAVAGWRTFMRLEAIEGPGQEVRVPSWLRRTSASTGVATLTKRNPLWLLVKKELRLQQMTMLVCGLYVFGWVAVVALRPILPDAADAFTMLTLLYALAVALLAGSFASAAERQLGTLEWQVLLPVAARKQWAVKVGVVLGLALLLAMVLPVLLASLSPSPTVWPHGQPMNPKQLLQPEFAGLVLLLTAVSLYVSSLCSSALWALMMSVPATFGIVMFAGAARDFLGHGSYAAASRMLTASGLPFGHLSWLAMTRLERGLVALLVAGFIALVLRFALANHRSADRTAGRVWMQVIVMAAFETGGAIILGGSMALGR